VEHAIPRGSPPDDGLKPTSFSEPRKELCATGGDAADGGATVPTGGEILSHRYTWGDPEESCAGSGCGSPPTEAPSAFGAPAVSSSTLGRGKLASRRRRVGPEVSPPRGECERESS
jgi:hypothetical protein